MNVNPGGKQPAMHDIFWLGNCKKCNFGVSEGTKQVLNERGINVDACSVPERCAKPSRIMRTSKNEKPKAIYSLESKGNTDISANILPKDEFIDHVWTMSKQYTKAYCKYTFCIMYNYCNTIPLLLKSITLGNI